MWKDLQPLPRLLISPLATTLTPQAKMGFSCLSPHCYPLSGRKRWGTVKNTFKNEKKESGFVARGHPVAGTALLSSPMALKV